MAEIVKLMKPADASILSVAAVGTAVNSIRNNSADLLLPVI
jgi:putative SOS response-associated peptidase YedK